MSLVPDVCTNVADWKLSKKTHKPFHDTNWNKASFKLNKTLDGLQQVRQLETHQNPSSNSFLHVCEMYQLPTTAKKKTATNISNHRTLTMKPFTKKNTGPPVLFSDNSMGLAGSRLGQFIRLNRSLISSSQRKTERFHLWKPMEVKFTEGKPEKPHKKTPPNGWSPKNVAIVGRFLGFFV